MQPVDDKKAAFDEAMKGVKPLKQDNRARPRKPIHTLAQSLKRQALESHAQTDRNFLSVEKVTPVDPMDMLSYKKDGVQEGVFKNLRLGKYQIDSVLNLQQYKFEQARKAVFETLVESHQRGVRTLLIQHGIGRHSKPFPAFLKSYVNQWLTEIPEVLAFHSALKHHGGLASVYVLLKKNRQEKQTNRERHNGQ